MKQPSSLMGRRYWLIDLGAQVSSFSSGLCEQMALNINTLYRLLELEGTGSLPIPYFEYIKSKPAVIRGYNKDVLLLDIPTMTYAVKCYIIFFQY